MTSFLDEWNTQPPYITAFQALTMLGWSILPLDQDKKPLKIGGTHADGTPKRLAWKHYQNRYPSRKELSSWQNEYLPGVWGVVTGSLSNVLILDFDGEAGQETLARLGLAPHARTGSGGFHVYLYHPGWNVPTMNSKSKHDLGKRWPGLDIRADGGYAAFCGQSVHGPYTWLREPQPDPLDILSEELRAFLGLLTPPLEHIPPARTDEIRQHAAGSASTSTLLRRALTRVHQQGEGRNTTGFWLACQLRDNGFSPEQAQETLKQFVLLVPQLNTKGQCERYTLEEARASLQSAYREAPRQPWQGAPGQSLHSDPPTATKTAQPQNVSETLPEIVLGGEQLREQVNQAVDAIKQVERVSPSLFLQSGRLVRVGQDEHQRPILLPMGVPELKEMLTHAANFYRLAKPSGEQEGDRKRPVSPSKELAEQILAQRTQPPYLPFPGLTAIVETPVMRPDGSILDTPGFDPTTRLYYAPQAGMEACRVPSSPTTAEREEALACIWSAIGEFPYVSLADKANALGLLLTPLVRPAIARHVPLALIDAPKQGTGKGLLSDVVSLIATGQSAAILSMTDSNEELQKAITSLLIEGATIITLDNITGRLQSKHLNAVLTSDMWRARILGASKMVLVPQRATWIATGNNIKLGGDLARRCYRIRLDIKVALPYMRRNFTHSDLATWVAQHRAELVAALLTLARAWYAAGRPSAAHLPSLGTFTGWVQMVGSILAYAGVPAFLDNLEQLYDETDEDNREWDIFLQAWHTCFGEQWLFVSDLVETIIQQASAEEHEHHSAGSAQEQPPASPLYECLPEVLQTVLKERPTSFRLRIGKALEKRVDACFGPENLRLERRLEKHSKKSLWRVVAGSAGSV